MAFNGSGTFIRLYNWVNDAANGIKILATRMDAETDGIATGLSTCITKDGQTTVTANISLSNFKLTSLGAATLVTDGTNALQVQNSSFMWGGTAGGTANALTVSLSPAITAYVAGQMFQFKTSAPNTTAVTLAVSGLTTKAIQNNAVALVGGEWPTGATIQVIYDGTAFQLMSVTNIVSSTRINTGDGTVALPAWTFTSDTDSGVYRIGANNIGVAANAAKVLDIATTGLGVTGGITATTTIAATGALSGSALTVTGAASAATVTGSQVATQAQMETGTATDVIVTPGRQKSHPGHPKAWVSYNDGAGGGVVVNASFGVSSVVYDSTGACTVTFSTAFSSANYCVVGCAGATGSNLRIVSARPSSRTTTTCQILTRDQGTSTADSDEVDVVFYGDQ